MPRRRPSWSSTVRRLLRDLVTFVRLALTSRASLAAENLFLREQLALYQERHTKPKRPDPATRIALVLLGWGFSGDVGRPPIPADLQRLAFGCARFTSCGVFH
jgi:hypothetical protein